MRTRVTATGDSTSLADRKRLAGQRMMIGFEGPSVGPDLDAVVREIRPGGYILFGRNIVEPGQLRDLNDALAQLRQPTAPPIRAVDQEGGRVQRLREPFAASWPSARVVARAEEHTHDVARGIASELRAVGFDLDFAPVADVDSNPANPVIGDRSFGRDPREVARHVKTWVVAMQQEGIAACAKHFPGHGDTSVDSHLELPIVERDERDLIANELLPFQAAISANVASIMSAHVVFPALDEGNPATLSPHVIPRLLRKRLGFDGLVFSDDLDMKAIAGRWDEDAIVAGTTAATVDVLLACRDPLRQIALFEALVRAQENDEAFQQACRTSVARLDRVRLGLLRTPRPPLTRVGDRELRLVADLVRLRGA